jgi:hypothetical protein
VSNTYLQTSCSPEEENLEPAHPDTYPTLSIPITIPIGRRKPIKAVHTGRKTQKRAWIETLLVEQSGRSRWKR